MSFKDIKGQGIPIEMLRGCIYSSSLAGAYLFIGEEGIGKYLAAKNLAKAINCQEKEEVPCDSCPSCLKIEKNQHPDVHFITPAESDIIKIEYIRQLKKEISLRPYEGREKVFIINDAERLNAEAANALLKVLEEPPRDSLMILISAKPALLFKTIISRCKIIRFYPLAKVELEGVLKKDYGLSNDLAHFLAYFSEGRIGLALRLKDADILREKNSVVDAFVISRKQEIDDSFIKDKERVRRGLNILATWFRDIYLLKIGTPHSGLIHLDRKEALLRYMGRYSFLELDEIINTISDSLQYLEQNINLKLLVNNLRMGLWKA